MRAAKSFMLVNFVTQIYIFFERVQAYGSHTLTYTRKSLSSIMPGFCYIAIYRFSISCCYFIGLYRYILPILSHTFSLILNYSGFKSIPLYFFRTVLNSALI